MARNRQYRITYAPFPNAPGMRSEVFAYAQDEAEARRWFERNYPGASIVEVTEL